MKTDEQITARVFELLAEFDELANGKSVVAEFDELANGKSVEAYANKLVEISKLYSTPILLAVLLMLTTQVREARKALERGR